MLAIGGINDDYVMESVNVVAKRREKIWRRTWVKIVSVAASLAIAVSLTLALNEGHHKDTVHPYNIVVLNGRMYEVIPFEDDEILHISYDEVLTRHGLSYPVDPGDMGANLGTFTSTSGEELDVFDYKPYTGQSVLIVRDDSRYRFALFCNLAENNTISINNLLQLYGFNGESDMDDVKVGDRALPKENIGSFYSELCRSTVLGSYVDTDNFESLKITIAGGDSDVLTFDYYPDKGVIRCAITFYQISDLLVYALTP